VRLLGDLSPHPFPYCEGAKHNGAFKRGVSPSFQKPSPSPFKERGIKRVPRKIKDFSGCLKGVRLISNLKAPFVFASIAGYNW